MYIKFAQIKKWGRIHLEISKTNLLSMFFVQTLFPEFKFQQNTTKKHFSVWSEKKVFPEKVMMGVQIWWIRC